MNTAGKARWPKLIRRYVYELIALYAILGLIAIGYISWERVSSDSLRQMANSYHLASNSHFLKAIVEIRHIEYQLSYQWAESSVDRSPLPAGLIPDDPVNTSASLYLVRHPILEGLALHREFKDSRFDTLNRKLESQLVNFEKATEIDPGDGEFPNDLSFALRDLLVPLIQLERLHTIERESILDHLKTMGWRQTQFIIVLVALLLIAGILTTRRALKAIGFITEQQVLSEQQVRVFSEAIEQSPVSVMLADNDANLLYVNDHFEKISGYTSDEVIGESLDFMHSAGVSTDTYQDIRTALSQGKSWNGEVESRKKGGELFVEKAFFSPVLDEDGNVSHFLFIKEDITENKQQEEQILYQAHYDSLTGLPNRFLALDRLSQHLSEALRTKEKVALLFVDLDDFKRANDTLGHETGDKLLIDTARRLERVVRSGDTVGRLGGDEFVVLLSGLSDSADALPIADNLTKQFREAFEVDGRELILTASIGIAIYPQDGDTASGLLRNADSAMYRAKDQGRNTYAFFTEGMNQEVSRRLAIEEQMHGALGRGEFYLVYQPKVEVNTGYIVGAEALLRWDNPAFDSVLPGEFIPIAEHTGLIVSLGEFVLAKAVQVAADWMKGSDEVFRMAVNLSPRQFRDPNLVHFIERTIEQSHLAGYCLEVDITEEVLMSGHSYVSDALGALHKLGVELVLDDFGTGYSSLSYLQKSHFTTLKIDGSFIEDIVGNPADQELVNATIAMAHGLGLKVVAEGVETDGQLQYLRAQGCEFAQGYLLGKPVTSEQFADLLATQRAQQAKRTN